MAPNRPSDRPTVRPSDRPTDRPTVRPFDRPTVRPTVRPPDRPSVRPIYIKYLRRLAPDHPALLAHISSSSSSSSI